MYNGIQSPPLWSTIIGKKNGSELLDSKTASASSSIVFTQYIDSTWDEYEVRIYGLYPATDLTDLWLRVSLDGGATYRSTASDYKHNTKYSNTGSTWGVSELAADTKIVLCRQLGNTAAEALSGVVRFQAPSSTAFKKPFLSDGFNLEAASLERRYGYGYYNAGNDAINAIQFLMSSGNITAGEFKLYGIRKT